MSVIRLPEASSTTSGNCGAWNGQNTWLDAARSRTCPDTARDCACRPASSVNRSITHCWLSSSATRVSTLGLSTVVMIVHSR
jgi:hypothetical protein